MCCKTDPKRLYASASGCGLESGEAWTGSAGGVVSRIELVGVASVAMPRMMPTVGGARGNEVAHETFEGQMSLSIASGENQPPSN